MTSIEMRDVSKRYGTLRALDRVTFSAPAGQVTAFCGPNGAGKSTALRVLTGIIRADSGAALVGGSPIEELPEPARQVGVLLDASAFHPGRSVRETLWLGALTIGVPKARADTCLEIVGLETAARRRVGKLSLGMRQRLGIAHALLGDPTALVLDEPSNGLDPAGMRWIDDVLRRFADDGGSVLVSTHHLAAIEQIADRLVAVSKGQIVAETATADIPGTTRTTVAATDPAALAHALEGARIPYERRHDTLVADIDPAVVGTLALRHGLVLTRLAAETPRFDEFFTSVTDAEFAGRSA